MGITWLKGNSNLTQEKYQKDVESLAMTSSRFKSFSQGWDFSLFGDSTMRTIEVKEINATNSEMYDLPNEVSEINLDPNELSEGVPTMFKKKDQNLLLKALDSDYQ